MVFSLDSLVKTPQNNQENNISRQNYCVENNNLFTFLISIITLLANNVQIFPRFYRFYCARRATADYCLPTKLPFPAKQSKYTKWWVELSSKIVEYLYNHVFYMRFINGFRKYNIVTIWFCQYFSSCWRIRPKNHLFTLNCKCQSIIWVFFSKYFRLNVQRRLVLLASMEPVMVLPSVKLWKRWKSLNIRNTCAHFAAR